MNNIIENFLTKIISDKRIEKQFFSIENNSHMDVLQEYLEKYGIDSNEAISTRNRILEGRFPERQAYNANGILVTFPTPEYKKRAIERGTHFENDPTKKEPNVKFDDDPTAQAEPEKTPAPEQPQKEPEPETSEPKEKPAEQPAEQPKEEPKVVIPTVSTPVLVLPPGEIKRRQELEKKQAAAQFIEKILDS